ncbi:MAG: hypothetical protein AAFR61_06740 [Bacteroidota bacterium]
MKISPPLFILTLSLSILLMLMSTPSQAQGSEEQTLPTTIGEAPKAPAAGSKPIVKDYYVPAETNTYFVRTRELGTNYLHFKMTGTSRILNDDFRVILLVYQGQEAVKQIATLPKDAPIPDTLVNTYKVQSDRVTIRRQGHRWLLGNISPTKFRGVQFPQEGRAVNPAAPLDEAKDQFTYHFPDYHLLRFTSDQEARSWFFQDDHKVQVIDYSGIGPGLAFDMMYRYLPFSITRAQVFVTDAYTNDQWKNAAKKAAAKPSAEFPIQIWIHLYANGQAGMKVYR